MSVVITIVVGLALLYFGYRVCLAPYVAADNIIAAAEADLSRSHP